MQMFDGCTVQSIHLQKFTTWHSTCHSNLTISIAFDDPKKKEAKTIYLLFEFLVDFSIMVIYFSV